MGAAKTRGQSASEALVGPVKFGLANQARASSQSLAYALGQGVQTVVLELVV
jgi:hypothetical protein